MLDSPGYLLCLSWMFSPKHARVSHQCDSPRDPSCTCDEAKESKLDSQGWDNSEHSEDERMGRRCDVRKAQGWLLELQKVRTHSLPHSMPRDKKCDGRSLFSPGHKTENLQLCDRVETSETGRSEKPHQEAGHAQPHQGPQHQHTAKHSTPYTSSGQRREKRNFSQHPFQPPGQEAGLQIPGLIQSCRFQAPPRECFEMHIVSPIWSTLSK